MQWACTVLYHKRMQTLTNTLENASNALRASFAIAYAIVWTVIYSIC